MRFSQIALAASVLVGAASFAAANDWSGFDLKPGERIIAIDGVPVSGPAARGSVTATPKPTATTAKPKSERVTVAKPAVEKSEPAKSSNGSAPRGDGIAKNIEGTLVRNGLPFSHTPGETALEKANYERRKNGVGNLIPDPELQALALQKARIAASRRFKNHIGGSLGGARAEGVGHTQGRFLSCCLDMPATYGGAAMVQGADGWYCCLLVR